MAIRTIEKQWVEITHVIPSKRECVGLLRDGGQVPISIFEIPPAFRWPKEGEIWTVERNRLDGTTWVLGCRVHHRLDEGEAEVTKMQPGEMRLDAEKVVDRQGYVLVAVDLSTIQDGDTIYWDAAQGRFVAGSQT